MQTEPTSTEVTYGQLLRDRGFRGFLTCQFLGAFNDNIFKMLLAGLALHFPAEERAVRLLQASAIFVLPFLLFSFWAGALADRHPKSSVLRATKLWEVGAMVLATIALGIGNWNGLLAVLFLLASQAAFFSPAKYGVVPELVPAQALSRANGLLELSTFVAIVVGGALGTFSAAVAHTHPLQLGLLLVLLALAGYASSRTIPSTPVATRPTAAETGPTVFQQVWSTNQMVWSHPGLRWSMLGNTYFWFTGGLCQSLLLLFAQQHLGVREEMAGAVVATLALGIGLGSVVAGRLSGDGIEFGLNGAGASLMGIACLALAWLGFHAEFHPHAWLLALPLLVMIGVGGGFFAIPVNSYLQHAAPAHAKGAVQAVNSVWNMAGVILGGLVLWLANGKLAWPPAALVAVLGGVTLLVAGLLFLLLPAQQVRFLLLLLMRCCFRIRVKGQLPGDGPVLLVANHVSYADAFLVGMLTHRPVRFLMWQVLYEKPLLRPVAALLQAIPLSQENPRQALKSLSLARQTLAEGGIVGIFPEGAISRDGRTAPFQGGYQRLLQGVNAQLIPIRLTGLDGHFFCPAPPEANRLSASRWWRNLLPWPKRWPVAIYIGKPVSSGASPEALREQLLALG